MWSRRHAGPMRSSCRSHTRRAGYLRRSIAAPARPNHFARPAHWARAASSGVFWRRSRDPYAIWVSEVMLQQTQVDRVLPLSEARDHVGEAELAVVGIGQRDHSDQREERILNQHAEAETQILPN